MASFWFRFRRFMEEDPIVRKARHAIENFIDTWNKRELDSSINNVDVISRLLNTFNKSTNLDAMPRATFYSIPEKVVEKFIADLFTHSQDLMNHIRNLPLCETGLTQYLQECYGKDTYANTNAYNYLNNLKKANQVSKESIAILQQAKEAGIQFSQESDSSLSAKASFDLKHDVHSVIEDMETKDGINTAIPEETNVYNGDEEGNISVGSGSEDSQQVNTRFSR